MGHFHIEIGLEATFGTTLQNRKPQMPSTMKTVSTVYCLLIHPWFLNSLQDAELFAFAVPPAFQTIYLHI